ncbi:MAG: hypothetical protein OEZ13_08725 [Spirochaetia bacterium]|nr:hypothetical protein [Spirochaetia bacterium]
MKIFLNNVAKINFFFIISISLLLSSCQWEDVKNWVLNWQKKEIERRYGKSSELNSGKIPEWQEEIREYENIINEKVEAGAKAGHLYRKIGESYALMSAFELCIENLNKAISMGYTDADVFFSLGICQANLSRKHNWNHSHAKEAEKSFLKCLNLDNGFDKAKFELSLIYFYGFSKNNPYRVLSGYLTIEQIEYQKHAVTLMNEYQFHRPDDQRSYFALSGMHKIMGNISLSIKSLEDLKTHLESEYPKEYHNLDVYKKAVENISLLQKNL